VVAAGGDDVYHRRESQASKGAGARSYLTRHLWIND
jgi:hypothetical protein